MFTYIIGLLGLLLLIVPNPLTQYLLPDYKTRNARYLSPRPQLNESLLGIDPPNATLPDCPGDAYGVRILRREPLVVYLEGFLSEEERKHLLEIRCVMSLFYFDFLFVVNGDDVFWSFMILGLSRIYDE